MTDRAAGAIVWGPARREALRKDAAGHKYQHGHAVIVSGDHGHSGAARLAARGALRIGAGVVTVASPSGAMAENAARLDAVMLRPLAGPADLAHLLEDPRISALCFGPGMGIQPAQAALLSVALQVRDRAVVLDADALTLLSRDAGLFGQLHANCVLTPHDGEFARLFGDLGPDRVAATRLAAQRAGAVVLRKGPVSIVAAPGGLCATHAATGDQAAPWLATAGSGDVLAGFVTGLLARGFAPFDAATTAILLHADCARAFGPGLIAEDLPEELPKVLRSLGL